MVQPPFDSDLPDGCRAKPVTVGIFDRRRKRRKGYGHLTKHGSDQGKVNQAPSPHGPSSSPGADSGQPDQAALTACIERIATRRDKAAFATVFAFYAPKIKSYLMGLRATSHLAEELCQEILLTVWRKAEQFEIYKGSPNAWIYAIARNRYIDEIRKTSKPPIDPYEFELTLPEAVATDRPLEAKEVSERLHEGLAALPEEQAEVVRMCFLEGKSHAVIARELDIPLGTVKSRSRLAFARLRSVLEDLQ